MTITVIKFAFIVSEFLVFAYAYEFKNEKYDTFQNIFGAIIMTLIPLGLGFLFDWAAN